MMLGPVILHVAEPDLPVVTLQALVKLPEVSPREETAIRAVAEHLLEGTEEYSRLQLVRLGNQTGVPFRIEMVPGRIRISLTMPKNQASTGASMLESVLCRPDLRPETYAKWIGNDRGRKEDAWSTALWPTRSELRGLRLTDVQDAYRRYFRPENLTIAMAGACSSADVESLKLRFTNWTPPRAPRLPSDFSAVKPKLQNGTPVSTLELRGAPFVMNQLSISQAVVLFALGVGKDSSLFRVVREEMEFSYRQEGILWPTPRGLQPRLLIARADSELNPIAVEQIRSVLLKDVESWSLATVYRAQGAMEAAWSTGVGPNPLYLGFEGPLSSSIEDRAFLAAYWQMANGAKWDPVSLCAQAKTVSLEAVKVSAQQFLQSAEAQVILGSGKVPSRSENPIGALARF